MDGPAFLAALAASGGPTKPNVDLSKARANGEWLQFNGVVDSFPVATAEVNVVPHSAGDHDRGSSRLRLRSLVNFAWPHAWSYGQTAAVGGKLLAYAIMTSGKHEGFVRVQHRKSGERTLLKGMRGKVKDLAFARSAGENTPSVLGVVDEMGTLFVFSVQETADGKLKTETMLQVNRDEGVKSDADDLRRIIWCPHVPDGDEDSAEDSDDPSPARLLVLTHNDVAEMWNVDIVLRDHAPITGPITSSQVKSGMLRVDDHKGAVVDASFSPDGTALATASLDGRVKFFQVYMPSGDSPRRLHQWIPHGGKPLSSLFFLDNHRDKNNEEPFWKYVVTGCDYNAELKIWSCESWACLQTIRFRPQSPPSSPTAPAQIQLKAALDVSAKFLLLSDIFRKNIYVLQLQEVTVAQ